MTWERPGRTEPFPFASIRCRPLGPFEESDWLEIRQFSTREALKIAVDAANAVFDALQLLCATRPVPRHRTPLLFEIGAHLCERANHRLDALTELGAGQVGVQELHLG